MINAKILELFASRICHDLISPIGAINNGLEFMREMGADAADDAVDLIAHSANQATTKLETFRALYGAGSTRQDLSQKDIYETFSKLIALDGKVTQEWDPMTPLHDDPSRGLMKVVLGAMVLALDCLPRGGTVSVKAENGAVIVSAESENCQMRDDFVPVLKGDINFETLEPKTVPAAIIYYFCEHYGFSMDIDPSQNNSIIFKVR